MYTKSVHFTFKTFNNACRTGRLFRTMINWSKLGRVSDEANRKVEADSIKEYRDARPLPSMPYLERQVTRGIDPRTFHCIMKALARESQEFDSPKGTCMDQGGEATSDCCKPRGVSAVLGATSVRPAWFKVDQPHPDETDILLPPPQEFMGQNDPEYFSMGYINFNDFADDHHKMKSRKSIDKTLQACDELLQRISRTFGGFVLRHTQPGRFFGVKDTEECKLDECVAYLLDSAQRAGLTVLPTTRVYHNLNFYRKDAYHSSSAIEGKRDIGIDIIWNQDIVMAYHLPRRT